VGGEQLVVVRDDPVVDADHRPVADRMVVGRDRRVALGVVPDVHEHLGRLAWDGDPLEELRGGRPLLHDGRIRLVVGAVGVPDGVGAALGDGCEERLCGQGALDA